jgi:hypothetical protein
MFATLHKQFLDHPHEVSLETLAVCNAACTFCPYPTLERQGTMMPLPLIETLIMQMAEWPNAFYFSPFKVNEPLLDARLLTICRRMNLDVPKAMLRIFTNGSPLTPRKIDEIGDLRNLAHVWISLNSHDAVEYEKIMALPFARTAHNLDALHKRVHKMEFPHSVVLSKVTTTDGEVEKPFTDYCTERWPLFDVQLIKQDGWLGYVPPASPLVPATPCVRWFELSILATGIVSLCCMDGKGEFPIGDVRQHTLLTIYNSPHWRARREQMISRRAVHPCSTCTY